MEINSRITKVIEESRLSPSEFADKIDVQRSSISHITSGRNKPSLEFIIKIKTAFPDLQWDWLINGQGTMIKEEEEIVPDNLVEEESKMSLPDLFTLIDDDKFGHTESEDGRQNANAPESFSAHQTTTPSHIIDSQGLENPPVLEEKKANKSVKRIVFFYHDGTFETFEN